MLVIRRDQLQRLSAAREIQLRRQFLRTVARAFSDDAPSLQTRAMQVARSIEVESGEYFDEVAGLIRRRCEPADDTAIAGAIELVLRHQRPIASRVAFIHKHLLPHLR